LVYILEVSWINLKKIQGPIYQYFYTMEGLFVNPIRGEALFEKPQRVEGFFSK
jgi:hypothetical protein